MAACERDFTELAKTMGDTKPCDATLAFELASVVMIIYLLLSCYAVSSIWFTDIEAHAFLCLGRETCYCFIFLLYLCYEALC